MKLFRYRLSSILICFTVVALLLGYAQVRRRHLATSFAELKAKGCNAAFEDHWLWPVAPEEAGVTFRECQGDDGYTVEAGGGAAPEFMAITQVVERFKSLRAELLKLGVKEVSMFTVRTDPASGVDVTDSIALESIGL
jgi:hypothetical protein